MCLRRWFRVSVYLCAACLTVWLSVACAAPATTLRELRLQLGMERPLVHQDVPAAASLGGFTRQVALSQTKRMTVRIGTGGRAQTITDPALMSQAIGMMRTGTLQATLQRRLQNQTLIQIQFLLQSPERTVTMYYDPSAQIVRVFNTPTQTWPDHVVADYAVPATFGANLLAAMQVAP